MTILWIILRIVNTIIVLKNELLKIMPDWIIKPFVFEIQVKNDIFPLNCLVDISRKVHNDQFIDLEITGDIYRHTVQAQASSSLTHSFVGTPFIFIILYQQGCLKVFLLNFFRCGM